MYGKIRRHLTLRWLQIRINMIQGTTTVQHVASSTIHATASFTIWETIGISIAAGVITVFLLGIIKFVYNKGLLDYINKKIKANSLNVEGTWFAESIQEDCNGVKYKYMDQTTIKQIGRVITGKSLYTTIKGVAEETKEFNINGFMKNDVLFGTYENINNTSIGAGSFTLILQADGKELNGYFLIYSIEMRKIEKWDYKLIKRTSV